MRKRTKKPAGITVKTCLIVVIASNFACGHWLLPRLLAGRGLAQPVAMAPEPTRLRAGSTEKRLKSPHRSLKYDAQSPHISIDALIHTESGGDVHARGDNGKSLGLCQMGKGAWADAMQHMGENWNYDRYVLDPDRNKQAANAYINGVIPRYLRAWGIPDSIEARLCAYKSDHGRLRENYRLHGPKWLDFAPVIVQRDVVKYRKHL